MVILRPFSTKVMAKTNPFNVSKSVCKRTSKPKPAFCATVLMYFDVSFSEGGAYLPIICLSVNPLWIYSLRSCIIANVPYLNWVNCSKVVSVLISTRPFQFRVLENFIFPQLLFLSPRVKVLPVQSTVLPRKVLYLA